MKRRPILGTVLALSLLSGAALAGCGGDDDGDDNGGDTTPASTQPAAAAEPASDPTEADGDATKSAAGGGVEKLTVTAADFSFEADISSVAPGSVVEVSFTNSGSAPHTVTLYTDEQHTEAIPGADSGQVAAGGSMNFTFEAPEDGSVFYRCEVHPAQMDGELTVE